MSQLVYGKNVVKQMLNDGSRIQMIYLSSNDQEIIKMAAKAKVPIRMTDRKTLSKMAGNDHHNGCAAKIQPWQTYSMEQILDSVPNDRYGLLIMLDELEDPHNLGAILRTADAVGADGVIFRKNRSVGLTATVAKTSAGAIDTVKCAAVTNLSTTIEELKKKGWWVIGADMDGQDYRSLDYDMNTVLVIGNEGKGISRLVKEKCDLIISIPMTGKISSLNASVSAAVMMYQIYNKRFPL